VALISIFLAFSQTPVYTTRPFVWGECIVWCACLCPSFHRYSMHLPTEDGQAELTWVAAYMMRWFTPCRQSPIQILTKPSVD